MCQRILKESITIECSVLTQDEPCNILEKIPKQGPRQNEYSNNMQYAISVESPRVDATMLSSTSNSITLSRWRKPPTGDSSVGLSSFNQANNPCNLPISVYELQQNAAQAEGNKVEKLLSCKKTVYQLQRKFQATRIKKC